MTDSRGQISLELLLVFAISLTVLILFTLPLSEIAIENTLDLSDANNVKSQLSQIANGINQVYSEGQGSKKTVIVDLDKDITVSFKNNLIQSNFKLNDGSYKYININHDAVNLDSSLNLKKGLNKVVIHWPEGYEYLTISSS